MTQIFIIMNISNILVEISSITFSQNCFFFLWLWVIFFLCSLSNTSKLWQFLKVFVWRHGLNDAYKALSGRIIVYFNCGWLDMEEIKKHEITQCMTQCYGNDMKTTEMFIFRLVIEFMFMNEHARHSQRNVKKINAIYLRISLVWSNRHIHMTLDPIDHEWDMLIWWVLACQLGAWGVPKPWSALHVKYWNIP